MENGFKRCCFHCGEEFKLKGPNSQRDYCYKSTCKNAAGARNLRQRYADRLAAVVVSDWIGWREGAEELGLSMASFFNVVVPSGLIPTDRPFGRANKHNPHLYSLAHIQALRDLIRASKDSTNPSEE